MQRVDVDFAKKKKKGRTADVDLMRSILDGEICRPASATAVCGMEEGAEEEERQMVCSWMDDGIGLAD